MVDDERGIQSRSSVHKPREGLPVNTYRQVEPLLPQNVNPNRIVLWPPLVALKVYRTSSFGSLPVNVPLRLDAEQHFSKVILSSGGAGLWCQFPDRQVQRQRRRKR